MKCRTALQAFILISLHIFLLTPSLLFADSVEYLYDDLGRLVRVTKPDNTRVLYYYDEVGNLLSITKETSTPQALPPMVQGIDPDIFLVGGAYNIAITGQNLFTTSSIATDNPDISVKLTAAIDTKIVAVLSISSGASSGQANLTVTTTYGSASMTINLYKLAIMPEVMGLFPGKTSSFSVSLTPSAPEDLKVAVINNNPDIIETQSSVTIPAGASAGLTVKALKGGGGTINIGGTEAMVYVFEDGALMNAMPVSVYIEESKSVSGAATTSLPVSVYIEQPAAVDAATASLPVSVFIEQSTAVDATAATMPVSVYIEQPTAVNAIAVSSPVSAYIEQSSTVDAIAVSPLVSAEISSQ